MLATTVSYLNVLESARHNRVTESQQDTQLSINQQAVNIQAGQLEENKRHNRVAEEISWGNLNENIRHNLVTEGINEYDAQTRRAQLDINRFDADTRRYAAVQNAGIGWANVAVNQGQLRVAETRAANDFVIGSRNANANIKQAQVAEARQQEEVRWHDVTALQNQENLTIRQEQLEWDKSYQQQRLEIDKADMIWGNTLDTINTASTLFHNLATDLSNATQDFRPESKFIKKKRRR